MSNTPVFRIICPGLSQVLQLFPQCLDGQARWIRKLCSPAQHSIVQDGDAYASFLEAVGIVAEPQDALSSAPVAALADLTSETETTSLYCYHVAPVNLHADRDQMLLYGSSGLAPSAAEATALVQSLNTFLAEEHINIQIGRSGSWYLQGPTAPPQPLVPSLFQMHGKTMFTRPLETPESRYWSRLGCEIEMLLHEHEVNRTRIAQGRPSLNSLWLWGGGRYPHIHDPKPSLVLLGQHPLVQGAALLYGISAYARPEEMLSAIVAEANVVTFWASFMDLLLTNGQIRVETAIDDFVVMLEVAKKMLLQGHVDHILLDDVAGQQLVCHISRWRRFFHCLS